MTGGGRLVCFGEMLLRLSPEGGGGLLATPGLGAHFGGAETNVAVALARLGHDVALATRLPDTALGDAALEAVRGPGVDVRTVMRASGRMGLYYLLPGTGLRASQVIYDRADSLFARSTAADFDWATILDGASWLHMSGITPALGPQMADLALTVASIAVERGARLSLDGNYRASLWDAWDSDPAAILRGLVEKTSLLIGNHRDIGLLLGRSFDGDSAEGRRKAALAAFAAFPRLEAIASTCRRVESSDRHHLAARLDRRDGFVHTPELTIDRIVDRIGTGDAFAAGVLHSALAGEIAVEEALRLAALKHYTPGDFSRTTRRELAAFTPGDLDVRR